VPAINMTGNPGMATGGMGDALSGLLAGLLAQGLEPFAAASAAVFLHGRAADVAVRRGCQAALAATDMIRAFPPALAEVMPR
jgi:NAD(P)H-hydrate epimerase